MFFITSRSSGLSTVNLKLEKSLTNNQQLKKIGYNDKANFTNKCIPIDQVDFKETTDQLDLFENDYTGLCGS